MEYGSVCFTNMAKTHMLDLEKIQYRAFRIALGLMGFTLNNCLGGVVVFYRLGQRDLEFCGRCTWVAASKDNPMFYHWV
jgi:hypothetical protein